MLATARPRSDARVGVIAILLATVAFGAGGPIVKSTGVSGLAVAFWRLWIGVAVFLVATLVSGQRVDARLVRRCAPAGLLFAGSVWCYFAAVQHTSIAAAAIIGALGPLAVLVVAVGFLGEAMRPADIALAAAALAGVLIVVLASGGGGDHAIEGDLLAAASVVVWVGYFFVTKKARADVAALPFLTAMMVTAAVATTPVALLVADDTGDITRRGLLWVTLMALLPGLVGHGLWTWSLRHVDSGLAATLSNGEPVFATIIAAVFLDESVRVLQVIGIAVVVLALALLAARTPAEPAQLAPSPAEPQTA